MVKPDYDGGSLLNLMATICSALGLPASPYAPLAPDRGLDAAALAASRHIVLLVVDGLGDDILARHAPDSTLARHQVGSLTSVFPSTTASAIPTFLTGLPPQAHGLTGWHMWFEEINQILAVLPLTPRGAPPAAWMPACVDLPAKLFNHAPLSQSLAGRTWSVVPRDLIESSFNRFHSAGAQRIGYQGTAGLFAAIEACVAEAAKVDTGGRPTYIHAYYPVLDSLMHEVGTRDDRVAKRLAKLDAEFAACRQRLAGSGATFLVTADHGFIDAPPEHLIDLDRHPELAALLSRPLCGERRVAYAYVEHNRQLDFETYVKRNLSHACQILPSQDFLAAGWLGPGPAHPRLPSRVGDFVIFMKDDWAIKDWMPGEKHYDQRGVHGGASEAEMRIPLIQAPCL
ncbi:MAG: type phosphodiesterase/nucleotide pyrophosphatase [Rhodocyclaceae bacterium]|nr:type phosphodiesterase/nucleotide pyrophosphatase [Rhodocyclaceae bacterium]